MIHFQEADEETKQCQTWSDVEQSCMWQFVSAVCYNVVCQNAGMFQNPFVYFTYVSGKEPIQSVWKEEVKFGRWLVKLSIRGVHKPFFCTSLWARVHVVQHELCIATLWWAIAHGSVRSNSRQSQSESSEAMLSTKKRHLRSFYVMLLMWNTIKYWENCCYRSLHSNLFSSSRGVTPAWSSYFLLSLLLPISMREVD